MTNTPEIVQVGDRTWKKDYSDDHSAWWYECAGLFGELIVEPEWNGSFTAYWWPPKVNASEPVLIRRDYKSYRSAMKAGHNYLNKLRDLLVSSA